MQIIIDTREKYPWLFESTSASVISQKLDTGDYSIEGLEDLLCIERKRNVAELAGNITTARFKNELERMSQFKYKFLILEFDYRHIDDFPAGSDIPRRVRHKLKVKGPFIIKFLSSIMCDYHINVLLCSNTKYAEHIAYSIIREVYNKEK